MLLVNLKYVTFQLLIAYFYYQRVKTNKSRVALHARGLTLPRI